MGKYTPMLKHNVLRQYRLRKRGYSLPALARAYSITGGESVIRKWLKRWDGTMLSLERKPGTGRKPILTPLEVQRHILRPIQKKNEKHQAVHCSNLEEPVEKAVGHSVSVRTIQRKAKEALGCKAQTTFARAELECILSSIIYIPTTVLFVGHLTL